ncbi:MAG: DndE family protein [Carboxydocellales bacterium]
MQFRLKTSVKTMNILKDLQSCTNLTPNVLARLAISLSLGDPDQVDNFPTNTNGLEFNRHTLTGSHDLIYKSLIAQHCGRHLTDEEYFPYYIKLHLDRGVIKLFNEYKYAGNFEKLITNLVNLSTEV